MKLSSCYRVRRSSDRETLSNLYAVDLIIIIIMHFDIRSLQSSVSVRELKDFFSILHTAYYKSADSDNVKFLYSVKTFLKFSISAVLM